MAKTELNYPEIPDQRRFTIGEVCELCQVKRHTLRYWEKLYAQLSRVSRHNNRRYYTPADVFTIRTINQLRHNGLTSQGIAKALSKNGEQAPAGLPQARKIRSELQDIVKLLK